jgi:HK97 family phage major capsid protein
MDQARIAELKSALDTQEKAANEALDAIQVKDGVLVVTDDIKAEHDTRMKNIREIKGLLRDAGDLAEIRSWLNAPEDGKGGIGFAADAAAAAAGAEMVLERAGLPLAQMPRGKTLAKMFLESDAWAEMKASGSKTMPGEFKVDLFDVGKYAEGVPGTKEVYSSLPTGGSMVGGTPFGAYYRDEMAPIPMRKGRVRDLFNVVPTTAKVIEFFRQTGFTNNASMIPEWTGSAFGAAPHSTMSWIAQSQTTKRIGHYEGAHYSVLEDEPQLQDTINTDLLYGLQLREDQQILTGNQSTNSEDLPGILNDSGIQTYARSAGPSTDNYPDAVRRAITKVILAYLDPTGIVVNPTDWEAMELTKSTTGEYLLAVSIALGGEQRLWRLPVVDTAAMAQGTGLVGAFGIGCKLYDRQEARIRIAEQHSDWAVRDGVAIIADERIALCMRRPESFVKVTF